MTYNALLAHDESPIRVSITPAQASFFAGETLAVTIAFTNIRTPSSNSTSGTAFTSANASTASLNGTAPGTPESHTNAKGLGISTPQASAPNTPNIYPSTLTPTQTPTPTPNTPYTPHTPRTPASRVAGRHMTHRRNAHSVSSAPLARPPTSPGMSARSAGTSAGGAAMQRTRSESVGAGAEGSGSGNGNGKGGGTVVVPTRRGLIGKGIKRRGGEVQEREVEGALLGVGGKAKARSLSVDIPNSGSQFVEVVKGEESVVPSGKASEYGSETGTSSAAGHSLPILRPSISRTSTLPLPASHPHARKQSVLDGSLDLSSFSPSSSTPSAGPASAHPSSTPSSYLSVQTLNHTPRTRSPLSPASTASASTVPSPLSTQSPYPNFTTGTSSATSTSSLQSVNGTHAATAGSSTSSLGRGAGGGGLDPIAESPGPSPASASHSHSPSPIPEANGGFSTAINGNTKTNGNGNGVISLNGDTHGHTRAHVVRGPPPPVMVPKTAASGTSFPASSYATANGNGGVVGRAFPSPGIIPQPPHTATGATFPASARQPPPSSSSASQASGIASAQTQAQQAHPDSALILYSYAQLVGTLVLAPESDSDGTTREGVGGESGMGGGDPRALAALRRRLARRAVLGGGSMDLGRLLSGSGSNSHSGFGSGSSPSMSMSLPGTPPGSPRRQRHGRSASLTGGLLSLLSPSAYASASASSAGGHGHQSSPSLSLGGGRWGLSNASVASVVSAPASSAGSRPPSFEGSRAALTSSPGVGLGIGLAKAESAVVSGASGGGGYGLFGRGGGAGGGAGDVEVDAEAPLPTFEVQPAMLAVDLALAPGETRTYTYSISLPANLPPTFRGRALRFGYELVVGTCRASAPPALPPPRGLFAAHNPPPSPGGSQASVSRVMKVPVRVYNHVAVGRVPRPYDLLWPVTNRARPVAATVTERSTNGTGTAGSGSKAASKPTHRPRPSAILPASAGQGQNGKSGADGKGLGSAPGATGSLADLREYGTKLLASCSRPSSRAHLGVHGSGAGGDEEDESGGRTPRTPRTPMELERELELELEGEAAEGGRDGGGGLKGCREAVEILTRNPRKASYDVTKDGVKVAVLTFTKSAYRLGETILGAVELNERTSRAKVLSLSAFLEAHEALPSSLAGSSARSARRVHAEHYASFVAGSRRTTFTLNIPSDASPAFQVLVGAELAPQTTPAPQQPKPGGLQWRVRLCLLVAVASPTSQSSQTGVRLKHLVRDTDATAHGSDARWGASWRAPRTLAPLELPAPPDPAAPPAATAAATGWTAWMMSSLLGTSEVEYHDGDEYDNDDDVEGGEHGGIFGSRAAAGGEAQRDAEKAEKAWVEVRAETVECEVPIAVWPGNTAFKAMDVVFDV
ncbi:Rgp1-domain-containing protein [Coniophora puteana RWD-64-598 SS2]|uniref:Rgp1-domain-containing protein n=1 Tax=Coniophora puteana (strain RWD-64-598) TaxID=741705 RepID=A0A5M3N540_CONPW|nr:Rgp1-domain-containing protein [Coniophora puteana RWD-64-598 SS2]EIW86174.1 Rgp1-domain-containing protein [Coniophora puteana RWD-64-598 SS2]